MKLLKRLFAFGVISFYMLGPSAIVFAASPAPTCTMSVTPSSIAVGGSVTLKWSSTDATGGAITNVGNVGPSGSKNLLPSSAAFTTYIGSFTGPGGTANCSATVQVGSNGGGSTLGGGVSGDTGGTAGNDTTYGTQNATLGNTTAGAPVSTSPISTVSPNGTNSVLVPCGTGAFSTGDSSSNNSTGCQACDLATLIQNIINFLIGISIPLAAALFAWAGVLYFTSAGDHHKLDQAKEIFKNVFFGFLIVISAWLVINTLLHVLFSQGEFANGNWFTIQCSSNSRPVTGSIGTVLGNLLGTAQVTNNVISTTPGNGYTAPPTGFVLDDNGKIVPVGGQTDQPSGFVLDSEGRIVPIDNSIANAAAAYKGTDTSAGPDDGNLACAWAVNNVLKSAGIAPIDGDSVYSMEQQLKGGRGTLADQSSAQAGDIVVFGGMSHVGICQNAGCSQAISNSSSDATFTSVYAPTSGSRIYHVNK